MFTVSSFPLSHPADFNAWCCVRSSQCPWRFAGFKRNADYLTFSFAEVGIQDH